MQGIRIGVISSYDSSTGEASVFYPDLALTVTQKMKIFAPFGCRQTLMKDDQVLVVHLSNGSEAGIIIGKIVDEGAGITAAGGELALTGAAGSITLSDLIKIKNKVL